MIINDVIGLIKNKIIFFSSKSTIIEGFYQWFIDGLLMIHRWSIDNPLMIHRIQCPINKQLIDN